MHCARMAGLRPRHTKSRLSGLTPKNSYAINPEIKGLGTRAMKAVDVQQCLSMYGDASIKRAEAIGTVLRSANMLPSGGRGRHAPDITVEQAAMFALAVAAAESVADAVKVALPLAGLENNQEVKLIDRLSGFILDLDAARSCEYVHLLPSARMAVVTYADGGAREWFFAQGRWEDEKFVPSAQGQGFAGRIGYIGGAVFAQMAIDFADQDDEGELVQ